MKVLWRLGVAAGVGMAAAAIITRPWIRISRRASPDPIHELTRDLTRCDAMPEMLAVIERSFTSSLGFPLAIFVSDGDRLLVGHHNSGFSPDHDDLARATLSISSGRLIAHAVSDVRAYFLPLTTWKGTVGAFAFQASGTRRISFHTWALIRSFGNQAALAILRATLEDRVRHAEIVSEADRLQNALLNSVAHNVRTPLASIIGLLSTLQEQEHLIDGPARRDLIDTARQEAERLNRLLGNLLDLSRLEAGALHIRKDPSDVQDLIGASLEQLRSAIGTRRIDVIISPDLPFVELDFVLIVQVLVNLLDNALKYSPVGPPITVEARVQADHLEVCVSDFGSGVAETDLAHIFEKFHRGGRTGETGGIGLGLSICKGLVEAHYGTIRAERRQPRGTAVTFTLPIHQSR